MTKFKACPICYYRYSTKRSHCPTCGAKELENGSCIDNCLSCDLCFASALNAERQSQDVREAERVFRTESN